jgi:branched-subunit amino acid aminotransferase/4-amino-4-deoxychorismate lyase
VEPEEATIPLTDPSVQSALGSFETMAIRDGQPIDWVRHLDRLRRGAARLDVPVPDESGLVEGATRVSEGIEFGWLKIVVLRTRSYLVFAGSMDPSEEGRSVSAILLPWRRSRRDPLAGLKTLNYAPFALGLEEARRRGADEGIWLNDRGHVAEACASNLFVVWQGKVFTPSVRDGILPGVVRGLCLEAARRLGLPVHVGKTRLRRLERAGEAFLTSSVRGVRPLVRFQGKPVGGGKPGPVTRAIAAEVERLREPGYGKPVAR